MFSPMPIPGFTPNSTSLEFDRNTSWYETYKFMAQSPDNALAMVSNATYLFRPIILFSNCELFYYNSPH